MAPELKPATETELAAVPNGYVARGLTVDDVENLMPLEAALFPQDQWSPEMMAEELGHPEWRRYWGVESGGELVAYAGLQYSPHLADVQTIGVLPEHAGRGLGHYLMTLMVSRARDWGATSMMLEVRASNASAQGLYIRHGFGEIARRHGYYPGGEDAVIMQRDLRRTEQNESENS